MTIEAQSRSLAQALDNVARQMLCKFGRPATHQAVSQIFHETQDDWHAYVNGGRGLEISTLHVWLTHWDRGPLDPIAVIETAPGRFRVTSATTETSFRKWKAKVAPKIHKEPNPAGLEFVGEGTSRRVYRWDDDTVVKVARTIQGLHINAVEARMYAEEVERLERIGKGPSDCGLARCWLGKLDPDDEDDVLFMEWVEKSKNNHGKHRKHLRHVDRGQLGYRKDGRLVKFDYGG